MRFAIPPELLRKLRDRFATRQRRDIELNEDAFLLFPGMGPALYLTSDGRVLKDRRDWDESLPIEEGSDDDAVAALVIGAEDLDLPELLELIPAPLPSAQSCTRCGGSRWFTFKDHFGKTARVICPDCAGRGYTQ